MVLWAVFGAVLSATLYWWLGRWPTAVILTIQLAVFAAGLHYAELWRLPFFWLPPLAAVASYVVVLAGQRPCSRRS
jgi:hypothetical protein